MCKLCCNWYKILPSPWNCSLFNSVSSWYDSYRQGSDKWRRHWSSYNFSNASTARKSKNFETITATSNRSSTYPSLVCSCMFEQETKLTETRKIRQDTNHKHISFIMNVDILVVTWRWRANVIWWWISNWLGIEN